IALDGAVLSIDDGSNASVYGAGTTPRMIFEGRAGGAPSAAVTGFTNTLEEATAAARYARGTRDQAAAPATAPTAPPSSPGATTTPATTTPQPGAFEPVPAQEPEEDNPARIESLP